MRNRMMIGMAAALVGSAVLGAELRVGIIGLDTSHAVAFVKALNATNPVAEFAGCRVVAAYPQGSRDIVSSTSRVPGYIEQIRPFGVEIVESIPALLERCDAVLLESNDGRVHLEQALPVFKSGKRVFIDKPVAGTLADCLAIYAAAKQYNTPVFSASSLRYTLKTQEIRSGQHGKVIGADTFSPCALEPTHPDLFWYGIHGVESLFTLMGTGCERVVRLSTPGTDVAAGTWRDGRIGTFRGNRESKGQYGASVFMEKGLQVVNDFKGYDLLLVEIVKFFRSGVVPVSAEETIEIFAFMEAAEESKRRGGTPVTLEEVLVKARAAAAQAGGR